MEADWDVEIGLDAPSIDVPCEGFVELRNGPATSVLAIPEAANHPALRNALVQLNSTDSPVFTSKCDIWSLEHEEIDSDEFGARPEDARCGFASYIDVLLLDPDKFGAFEFHELLVRRIAQELQAGVLANCRVDLVVRSARVRSDSGCGLTIYVAGCGAEEAMAYAAWEAVLKAAVNATIITARLLPGGGLH